MRHYGQRKIKGSGTQRGQGIHHEGWRHRQLPVQRIRISGMQLASRIILWNWNHDHIPCLRICLQAIGLHNRCNRRTAAFCQVPQAVRTHSS